MDEDEYDNEYDDEYDEDEYDDEYYDGYEDYEEDYEDDYVDEHGYEDQIEVRIEDDDIGNDGTVKITGINRSNAIIFNSEKNIKKIIIGKDVIDVDFYYIIMEIKYRGIKIEIEDGNPQYKIVDDVIYSIDGKTLYSVLPYRENPQFVVQKDVEEVVSGAFAWYDSLEEITLDAKHAFYNLLYGIFDKEKLRRIIVPDGENSVYKFVDGAAYSEDGK